MDKPEQIAPVENIRTPTELLIKCMEDFGEDEPTAAVVVYITKGGDIAWASSAKHGSVIVGLLETAKHCVFDSMISKG